MQTVVISIITILSLICCESSLLASASRLNERPKHYAHWTHRARKFQSDRQKAEDKKKAFDQTSLNMQLIKHIKIEDVVTVGKLLRQGADANAQCLDGKSALMYAMFDKVHGVPLSSYELGREVSYGFAFRENPRIVELLMRRGAQCTQSNPYLKTRVYGQGLSESFHEKSLSLLNFIAEHGICARFKEEYDNGAAMITAVLRNLHRSAAYHDTDKTLDRILYKVIYFIVDFDSWRPELWFTAIDLMCAAGAHIPNPRREPPPEIVFKLDYWKRKQIGSVEVVLEEKLLPKDLVDLIASCLYANPQPGVLPYDLRALCKKDSLTGDDFALVHHYFDEAEGDVHARVNQNKINDSKQNVENRASANKAAADTVCDLLDLACKFDSVQLFDRLSFRHNRITHLESCIALYKELKARGERCKNLTKRIIEEISQRLENKMVRPDKVLEACIELGVKKLFYFVVFRSSSSSAYECLKLSLKKGIAIDAEGSDKWPLERLACSVGSNARCIALLLYIGIRYNRQDEQSKLLHEKAEDEQIKKMLQDPDHIEKYVTPEDLAEFAAIKKEREESLAAIQAKNGAQTAAAPQS